MPFGPFSDTVDNLRGGHVPIGIQLERPAKAVDTTYGSPNRLAAIDPVGVSCIELSESCSEASTISAYAELYQSFEIRDTVFAINKLADEFYVYIRAQLGPKSTERSQPLVLGSTIWLFSAKDRGNDLDQVESQSSTSSE